MFFFQPDPPVDQVSTTNSVEILENSVEILENSVESLENSVEILVSYLFFCFWVALIYTIWN
jgi:hypothetical protein